MGQQIPFFSIIIPTYARPQQLSACLASLIHLNYPRDRFEVIVVDDGSIPPLDDVVNPYSDRFNLLLLTQPNAGPATARNTGANKAQGQYLAFLDDDCTPDSNWLKSLAAHFHKDSACLVGGRTINALSNNLYSSASQALVDYLYAYYNINPDRSQFFTSNNMALSANIFRIIGQFDTCFPLAAGEDRELCLRWLSQGYRMAYVPNALVYHHHDLTLGSFWRQQYKYGQGAFLFRRAQKQPTTAKPPFSFYLNLLGYPFSVAPPPQAFLLFLLFILSQIAITLGFFRASYVNRSVLLIVAIIISPNVTIP